MRDLVMVPQAPSSTNLDIRPVGIHLFWYRFSAERRNKKRGDFVLFLLHGFKLNIVDKIKK